ncbi:pentatricopeptide repeat-containing protein chloroplastic-like [Trifolium medium]|uniref:Pentatricopeptide repeat-containing protein chloroplastic-like n=1 Tax=Trifolium medium TaxID=97028 RepID=A0A392NSG5_9FABA|nr:pentatricopeptide repeat-containing protein chloroplastic-like [Trifolium medium]
MEEEGIDVPIDIYHTMMDGYTMIGNEEKCLIVFERLKNIHFWTETFAVPINHLLGSEVSPVTAQRRTFTFWHLVLMEVYHGTPMAIFMFSACLHLQWNYSATLPCDFSWPCIWL